VLACGHAPKLTVAPGTATAIATGGVIPRGADAVVMIEHTELIERAAPAIDLRRASRPDSSSPMRAPTSRAARRCCGAARRSPRARSACWRPGPGRRSMSWGRPTVAVLSTGDELAVLDSPLRPGRCLRLERRDHLRPQCEKRAASRSRSAHFRTTRPVLEAAVRKALGACETSCSPAAPRKGRATSRTVFVSRSARTGVIVHGVALKPGKPLCLAVAQGKPIVVAAGLSDLAIFTFPTLRGAVIRAKAGLPPEAAVRSIAAVPVRIASELGRKEFVLVALVAGENGPIAFPIGRGSGSVSTFSQADGFLEVDALRTAVDPGTKAQVTLIGQARAPDLVIAAATASRSTPCSRRCPGKASRRAPSRSAAWAALRPRGAANATWRRST
jgi:putative molybdopterin biosynthesis protein